MKDNRQAQILDPSYARLDLAIQLGREINTALIRLFDSDGCSDPEFGEMFRRAGRLAAAQRDLFEEVRGRPVPLGCGCYLVATVAA